MLRRGIQLGPNLRYLENLSETLELSLKLGPNVVLNDPFHVFAYVFFEFVVWYIHIF